MKRESKQHVEKADLEYDPENFASTGVEVRDTARGYLHDLKVKLPPPITGKTSLQVLPALYVDFHNFISQREWAQIDVGTRMGGTTWMALLFLFDTTKTGSIASNHI